MSFRCSQCHVSTPPRIPATMVVVATRQVSYLNYDEEGEEVVSRGEEIVKEVAMCPDCADTMLKGK